MIGSLVTWPRSLWAGGRPLPIGSVLYHGGSGGQTENLLPKRAFFTTQYTAPVFTSGNAVIWAGVWEPSPAGGLSSFGLPCPPQCCPRSVSASCLWLCVPPTSPWHKDQKNRMRFSKCITVYKKSAQKVPERYECYAEENEQLYSWAYDLKKEIRLDIFAPVL